MKFTFVREWISPWRSYLAEFIGTFILVLVSCGVLLSFIFYGEIGVVGVAVASGFVYASAMYATASISGGHLNPAITLASWFSQRISGAVAFFYIFFQLLASFVAAYLLLYIFGQEASRFALGSPMIGTEISVDKALVVEAVIGAILTFTYFATMVDKRGPTSFGPLVLGLVFCALTLVALPLTGASMNPARVVGPAVISQSYESLMVAVVGPLLGSLIGVVYDFVFLRKGKR